ncbi:hypothetical protein, partial [Enterobacter hormaechei]|uniref:hypothetical protein n=1 Tax=Enterobacter hormaechei TaxID=158836 RepID=UPI0023E388E3
ESANVNFDEHTEVQAEEPKKMEEYRTFVYSYEGMTAEEDDVNQIETQQQVSVSAESQPVNVELHSEAELQNEGNEQSDSEDGIHDEEQPDNEEHSDPESERSNIETRTEPRLSKYVKRHHPAEQIIGDKDARPMTRNRLRNESCLLRKFQPKTVYDTLQDGDWYKAMEEEIDQIKKNKTWSLVPRPVDKNVIGTKWVFRNKLDENGEITRNKA